MNNSPPYGSLATRLAALQQRLQGGGWPPYPPDGIDPATLELVFNSLRPISADGAAPILIGASKTQPAEMLEDAIRLGLWDFGENKVQEAQSKWPALKARHPAVRLHLIGPLQSNKARDAVALFDVIQTIDRVKIADALAAACEKEGRHPLMLIQVNIGAEPQKAGVAPSEVADLLAHCRKLGLAVVGLMCVPPAEGDPSPYFAQMKKMADTLGLPELSMGMSGDFEIALKYGATMVRVGTALFGERA